MEEEELRGLGVVETILNTTTGAMGKVAEKIAGITTGRMTAATGGAGARMIAGGTNATTAEATTEATAGEGMTTAGEGMTTAEEEEVEEEVMTTEVCAEMVGSMMTVEAEGVTPTAPHTTMAGAVAVGGSAGGGGDSTRRRTDTRTSFRVSKALLRP